MNKVNSFLMLFLASASLMSFSQSCMQTLSIGVGTSWPPYYFDLNKKLVGINVEIVETLFSELNICPKYIRMPSSSRGLIELKKGNIDVLYAASFNKERAEIGNFSVPYRQENVRIFWKPTANKALNNSNLAGLFSQNLIAVINPGSYFGPEHDQALKTKKNWPIVQAASIKQRMGMIKLDRVSFSLEDEYAGLYYLNQNNITDIKRHPSIVYENQVSLLFSRKTVPPKQVKAINNAIINNQHKIKEIINAYTGALKTPNLIPK